ncbi:MAG: hypothetical protein IJG47_06505 [Microbacterium sp.]|nr:hypothetical protein [Microbacterium sp.]
MRGDELPGRPNTASAAVVSMVGMGALGLIALLLVPPTLGALAEHPSSPAIYIGPAVVEWLKTLNIPAKAIANMVSAFAVLLLTLFIEQSLRTAENVPVSTRRSIGTFALLGGVVTVICAVLTVAGAPVGGNTGAAVQTVGSACVVLFFASHIATHSVLPLSQQRKALDQTRENLKDALAQSERLDPISLRATVWTLVGYGFFCWVIVPSTGFVLAVAHDPDNSGPWVGILLGGAYIVTILFFLTGLTTPGSSPFVRKCAQVLWGILAGVLVALMYLVFNANESRSLTLPLLSLAYAAVAVSALPLRKMPRWTLTGAARSVQHQMLLASESKNNEATVKLDEWEAKLKVSRPRPAKARIIRRRRSASGPA